MDNNNYKYSRYFDPSAPTLPAHKQPTPQRHLASAAAAQPNGSASFALDSSPALGAATAAVVVAASLSSPIPVVASDYPLLSRRPPSRPRSQSHSSPAHAPASPLATPGYLPPIPTIRGFDESATRVGEFQINLDSPLPSAGLSAPAPAPTPGPPSQTDSPRTQQNKPHHSGPNQATLGTIERYRGRVTSSGKVSGGPPEVNGSKSHVGPATNGSCSIGSLQGAPVCGTAITTSHTVVHQGVNGKKKFVGVGAMTNGTVDELVSPLRATKISSHTTMAAPKLATLDYNSSKHVFDGLISTIPDQRRNIVAKRGEVFTLMVAGESGLGKTTLVNTLFGDKFEDTSSISQHQPLDSNTPKTTRIEVREAIYIENGFPVKFTVIDTPGFGDFTNNTHCWVPIINYIDNQHKLYMLQEEQPDRRKKVDTRVHVCLYFIRPSGKGLLPLDIKIMQELSTRVNLIPVLAKADSFTLKDREFFKQSVRDTIASSGIEIYSPQDVTPDMDPDIRDIPYAVIASETIVGHDNYGRPIRARPYRWGIAEVENEDHCDFVKLRRVLMEKYMLDLIDSTVDKHYQRYRKNCMLRRIEHARAALVDAGVSEAARMIDSEGGLRTLVQISKYGKEFLEDGQLENDPIFRERQRKMNDKFAVIVAFHEDRFESWRNELRKKQDELNQDIENTSKSLDDLQNTIEMLEGQRDYETDRADRESRGGFNKVRYGMRK